MLWTSRWLVLGRSAQPAASLPCRRPRYQSLLHLAALYTSDAPSNPSASK